MVGGILEKSKFQVIANQPKMVTKPGRIDGEPDLMIERPQHGKTFWQRYWKGLVKWALSLSLVSTLWYLVKYRRFLVKSRKILLVEATAAVVVMGDRHVGWETAMIKTANDLNIPTLIVPFAVSDPYSDFQARLRLPDVNQYRVSTPIEKIVAARRSQWVLENDGERILFNPVGNALAAKILNMMPDNPWTIGGGAAKRMAVDSQRTLRTFAGEGVPQDKMVVTGKPGDDQIYQAMTALDPNKVRTELGLSTRQPFILCSVPQLAEHGLLSWDEHWIEIEFLFKSLSEQQGTAVILSLHPQSNPGDYQSLAEKYGAVIADRRIYDLIPACAILVATYSSVVVQAIGSGKPTIVVDFYGLDYTYYDDEPGVIVVKDREVLAPTIERLLYNRKYYDELVQAQHTRKSDWILLDGECTGRVVSELYNMIDD